MRHSYVVAGHLFNICVDEPLPSWEALKWRYAPFAAEASQAEPVLNIDLRVGTAPADKGRLVLDDKPEEGMLELNVYDKPEGTLFEFRQPWTQAPNGWLLVDHDFKRMHATIDENAAGNKAGNAQATITSALMLAFMLATTRHDTLMAHAASVVSDDKAYLFIAKSGTGKSTHARLWIKNIPDVKLLNDDHPIVRLVDGKAVAYGSPWSGKTHCYHNASAPVGAIVRISRAPANSIERLSPLLAYASLATSFSGLPWAHELADARHKTLETIVTTTPCYTLHCLPDDEAALVCQAAVKE